MDKAIDPVLAEVMGEVPIEEHFILRLKKIPGARNLDSRPNDLKIVFKGFADLIYFAF